MEFNEISTQKYIIYAFVLLIISIKYYLSLKFNFWKSRNIVGPEPTLGFGNIKDVILIKKSLPIYLMEIYNIYKNEPIIGIFNFRKPILIIKDLDIIQNILTKDFLTFADSGISFHKKFDALSANLITLPYEQWQIVRPKLSPVFSFDKLKKMIPVILESGNRLEEYVKNIKNPIECKEVMTKYTMDVIVNCVFGIKTNIFSEKNTIYKMGKSMFKPSWQFKNFFFWIIQKNITVDFTDFIIENMNSRTPNNPINQDVIDILREFKKDSNKYTDINLSDNFLASQAFIFFAASFETSAITISNILYELALNQDIQDKLREEIKNNNLTYENINKMTYLDKIYKETLRKYPTIPEIRRKTRSDYTFNYHNTEDVKVTIPKNVDIWIPVYAIHKDPDIYPNPDVFDPERFSKQAIQARHPMCYLPFADGARNCIGAEFANYQIKIGVIKILKTYKLKPCKKTPIPYMINPKIMLRLTPMNDIYLKIISNEE